MKVKELIELLQKENQDAEITVTYYETNDNGTSFECDRSIYYVTKNSDDSIVYIH